MNARSSDLQIAVTLALLILSWSCRGEAYLTITPTVACPDDTVTFTCTMPGSFIQWDITPLQGARLSIFLRFNNDDATEGIPAFRGVRNDTSEDNVTATLTSLSEASIVEGFMVECIGASSREGPLPITVADPPSPPLSQRVSFTLNQPSYSNTTLEWGPPSSTGSVSVNYVVTISPTPFSGSPVTVEAISAQITVSYNTLYNVTIRADNCAGMSQESSIMDLIVCPTPFTAADVTITNTPPVTIGGSMLTFTCSRDNEVITSTCGSSGWSPDPGTFDCSSPVTDPSVTCDSPTVPYNGTVDINGVETPPFSLGSQVIYRCDEGLFPPDVRTSTCTDVGGRGEWVENPRSLVCRVSPVNCSLPAEPSNGTIVNYNERLNETVLEGTVLTYQCDNGFSLTEPNTITCTNAGVWSIEPEAIMCVPPTEAATLSTGATLAIGVTTTFVASTILGFLAGLLVMYSFTRKKAVYYTRKTALSVVQPTKPVGPVYEEVSPKEEIELNTNQAYGPVGL
ncbi:uncharacterized protein LOC135348532 isoform X1 [Halichondria panicea]|uniref:uncharacterized protein LOC135348532 isoform X1 n=1 Tax=Halichondria panicea TaxID=6063 RepID=UPI00312B965B